MTNAILDVLALVMLEVVALGIGALWWLTEDRELHWFVETGRAYKTTWAGAREMCYDAAHVAAEELGG